MDERWNTNQALGSLISLPSALSDTLKPHKQPKPPASQHVITCRPIPKTVVKKHNKPWIAGAASKFLRNISAFFASLA